MQVRIGDVAREEAQPEADVLLSVLGAHRAATRRYGWRGLQLLGDGVASDEALARLVSDDEPPSLRQVALLAASGATAQHTGADCIDAAGHVSGDGWAAQANLVDSPRVW